MPNPASKPESESAVSRRREFSVFEAPRSEKIRVELNLERWPSIWQPAKSKNKPKLRVMEREIKLEDGRILTSRVEISFNHLGTLTTEEQKMFYALIKRWEDSGRPEAQVYFSDRELARILGKKWGTNVIDSLTKSLRKLRTISLEWINSYYDKTNDGKILREKRPFTILGDLKIIEREEHGGVNQARGFFRFDDHIVRNLLANYTKPFFLQEFFKIKTDIGLLVYNHVDLMLSNKQRYERCTKDLFNDLGLKNADYLHMHKRKRALEVPLQEIVGLRISTGVISIAKIEKTVDKHDYKIVIEKSPVRAAASADLGSGEGESDEGYQPVIIKTIPPSPAKLKAAKLVQYFYKLFHGVDDHEVSDKAIDQATAMLSAHGDDKSRYIVQFSHSAAKETNFVIQHFGGIINYTSRALADFDQLQHNRARAAEREQRIAAQAAEEAQRHSRGEARLAILTPEQYEERFRHAQELLAQEFPAMARLFAGRQGSSMHEGAIRSRMIQQLENEEMQILIVADND